MPAGLLDEPEPDREEGEEDEQVREGSGGRLLAINWRLSLPAGSCKVSIAQKLWCADMVRSAGHGQREVGDASERAQSASELST